MYEDVRIPPDELLDYVVMTEDGPELKEGAPESLRPLFDKFREDFLHAEEDQIVYR